MTLSAGAPTCSADRGWFTEHRTSPLICPLVRPPTLAAYCHGTASTATSQQPVYLFTDLYINLIHCRKTLRKTPSCSCFPQWCSNISKDRGGKIKNKPAALQKGKQKRTLFILIKHSKRMPTHAIMSWYYIISMLNISWSSQLQTSGVCYPDLTASTFCEGPSDASARARSALEISFLLCSVSFTGDLIWGFFLQQMS